MLLLEGRRTTAHRFLPDSWSWGLHELQGAEGWDSGFSFRRRNVTRCSRTETERPTGRSSWALRTRQAAPSASTCHILERPPKQTGLQITHFSCISKAFPASMCVWLTSYKPLISSFLIFCSKLNTTCKKLTLDCLKVSWWNSICLGNHHLDHRTVFSPQGSPHGLFCKYHPPWLLIKIPATWRRCSCHYSPAPGSVQLVLCRNLSCLVCCGLYSAF